mmetsp:Transcript_38256/g.95786  ORF Transcript_38256/g.95786 Transcript_38256/m.95786 type:complete len:204 (+) Transcript_38256:403-1014(+)
MVQAARVDHQLRVVLFVGIPPPSVPYELPAKIGLVHPKRPLVDAVLPLLLGDAALLSKEPRVLVVEPHASRRAQATVAIVPSEEALLAGAPRAHPQRRLADLRPFRGVDGAVVAVVQQGGLPGVEVVPEAPAVRPRLASLGHQLLDGAHGHNLFEEEDRAVEGLADHRVILRHRAVQRVAPLDLHHASIPQVHEHQGGSRQQH